jgi:nucleoside triphosphate diphosphatase
VNSAKSTGEGTAKTVKETSVQAIDDVIEALLGPEGCPWDRKQTPSSLCDYVIEEAYELLDGIRKDRTAEIREELGDVLFLLLFITALYEREGRFSFRDVVAENAAKMIRRHPHVFGTTRIGNQEELLANWERIKREEKSVEGEKEPGLFSSLPPNLPPLLKAYRINSKAARVGFTWEEVQGVEEQLKQEWQEWKVALESGSVEEREEEFGDYLFTLSEYARRHSIKPNSALERTNLKFLRRFRCMEELAADQGRTLDGMTLDEMNVLWERAKQEMGDRRQGRRP